MDQKPLNVYEAAAYLKLSSSLLEKLTQFCPKYKETKKLSYTKDDAGVLYFQRSDLDDLDRYLRSPWPSKDGDKRADIPEYIQFAIRQESEFHCALCMWTANLEIAHIEPWSITRSHHPHNLLLTCPNHHSQYDYGFLVRPTPPSITESDIRRIKKDFLMRVVARESITASSLRQQQTAIPPDIEARFQALENQLKEVVETLANKELSGQTQQDGTNDIAHEQSAEIEQNVQTALQQIVPEFQPPFWRSDSLTGFIGEAYDNIQKTFSNCPKLGRRIIDLAELMFFIIHQLKNTESMGQAYAALFFMRAHSMLLAAIRLGMSGQFPETYTLLSGSIMQCLLGVHIGSNEESILTFVRQDQSDRDKAHAKSEFRRKRLLNSLQKKSRKVEKYAKELLDYAESWGQPGRSFDLFGNVEFESKTNWHLHYMGNSPIHFAACLKQIARTQICCVLMMDLIFVERFKILGVGQRLLALMQGL